MRIFCDYRQDLRPLLGQIPYSVFFVDETEEPEVRLAWVWPQNVGKVSGFDRFYHILAKLDGGVM